MSRQELVRKLKEKNPKLNIPTIEKIIDIFFKDIENALLNDKNVQLRDFGNIFIKSIKEKYSARNPKTGELFYVPKKKKVRFRASKKLKQILNT